MCRELGLRIPRKTVSLRELIYPWLLPDLNTMMLLDGKRHMTETDKQSAFQDVLAQYLWVRRFYTDGSKTDGSTGCAFTVNNAFFSHKLEPYMSVFTAELVTIHEALRFISDNRIDKAMICSELQSLSVLLRLTIENIALS